MPFSINQGLDLTALAPNVALSYWQDLVVIVDCEVGLLQDDGSYPAINARICIRWTTYTSERVKASHKTVVKISQRRHSMAPIIVGSYRTRPWRCHLGSAHLGYGNHEPLSISRQNTVEAQKQHEIC